MNKKIAIIIGILFALAIMAGLFVAGFFLGTAHQNFAVPSVTTGKDLNIAEEVFSYIKGQYVDKESDTKLDDGAIDGMIKSLGDPYTRRLKGQNFKLLEEQTNGAFSGVGIELGTSDGKIIVVSPIKDTPASRAGLKADDEIVKIDGKSTKSMSLEKAANLIRGKEGTKVTLTIQRASAAPFDVVLTRQQIKVPNVGSKILQPGVGYINIHQFSQHTGDDVKKELDDLKSKGAKGVILDLRSNPGGLLDEAVTVSSNFIKSGKTIVSTRPRVGKGETRLATGEAGDTSIPLVVLVDHGSASASEIVTGAMQDYGRGVIVGETTFGKGSVQQVITLGDNSGLVMTIAHYLTPKGRSINKIGVKPDVMVKLDKKAHPGSANDNQLNKAVEVLKDLISGKPFKKAS